LRIRNDRRRGERDLGITADFRVRAPLRRSTVGGRGLVIGKIDGSATVATVDPGRVRVALRVYRQGGVHMSSLLLVVVDPNACAPAVLGGFYGVVLPVREVDICIVTGPAAGDPEGVRVAYPVSGDGRTAVEYTRIVIDLDLRSPIATRRMVGDVYVGASASSRCAAAGFGKATLVSS
jgi:hypothetical protein